MINNIIDYMTNFFRNITWKDIVNITKYIIDISIVSYVVYKLLKVIIETRAGQLIKGIVILLVTTQVTGWLGLNTINFILKNTMTLGLMAILVVFQPEMRGGLERIGRSRFGSIFNFSESAFEEKMLKVIDEIVKAAEDLAKTSTGALMVIERETKLGDIIKTGNIINGDVTVELLKNIFYTHAPMHDGAVVIAEGKIKAAACLLPLTENRNISRDLGTRHRAAMGVTENSDAIVVVVSEETGRISVANDGTLTRNFVPDTLKKALIKALLPEKNENSKISIWRGKNIWKRVD